MHTLVFVADKAAFSSCYKMWRLEVSTYDFCSRCLVSGDFQGPTGELSVLMSLSLHVYGVWVSALAEKRFNIQNIQPVQKRNVMHFTHTC